MGNQIQGLKFKEMRPYRRNMQIVFQDPYGSLSPRMSVSDIIEEGLRVHHPHLPPRAQAACDLRAHRRRLDPETRFRYPHEFSGGQRQRIAVARALALEPTFIMLDEPTSALDMLIQSQMVDLLRDLQKRHALTYMFISHDLRVVAALASRLLVLRHGKMVEEGAAADARSAEGKRRGERCGRDERSSRHDSVCRCSAVACNQRDHHLQAVVGETPRRLAAQRHERPASTSATKARRPASPSRALR